MSKHLSVCVLPLKSRAERQKRFFFFQEFFIASASVDPDWSRGRAGNSAVTEILNVQGGSKHGQKGHLTGF
jgi:hypothetical protein